MTICINGLVSMLNTCKFMVGPPNALRGYLSSIIKPSQKKQFLQFYSGQNEKEFPLNFTKKTI